MAEAAVAQIQKEVVAVAKPDNVAQQPSLREHLAAVHKKDGARKTLEAAKRMLDPKDKFTQGVTTEHAEQAAAANIQGATPEKQAARATAEARLVSYDSYLKRGAEVFVPPDDADFANNINDRVSTVPWMSENMRSMTDTQKIAFVKSLSEDPLYKIKFNELLQERANFKITDAMKAKRLKELQKSDPAATPEQAAAQLEQEWQDSLNNIPADAATALISDQLDNAINITDKQAAKIDAETQKLATEQGRQTAQGVMEQFRERWADTDRGFLGRNDNRRHDFDAYAQGGLKAVFDRAGIPADQQELILNNPQVRAEYDSQFAESFVNQRLRTGKLSKENVYNIVDDPALGPDQATRVAKLQGMIDSHKQLQRILKKGQADGLIQNGILDKVHGMSQDKKSKALTSLLALLVLPLTSAAVLVRDSFAE